MVTPKLEDLPEEARLAARFVAERLRDAGERGWLVGGAVRDLALGTPSKDVDMATAARPERLEALFETAHEVGRAFGTLVVRAGPLDVQLTTFRKETGYRDSRRPDAVEYGISLEEDARRRDFTCNALYLDPLTDELADPTGGLADLERGLLRCVGRPEARFREDGLRLLRLARLAARFGLEVDAETARAASSERGSLVGVSAERVLGELTRMLDGPRAARALGLLAELGLTEGALPDWSPIEEDQELRLAALREVPDPPGAALGFALLLGPLPEAGLAELTPGRAAPRLRALRASRELLRAVSAIELGLGVVHRLRERGRLERGERALALRTLRETSAADVLLAAAAWYRVLGLEAPGLELVRRLDAETADDERRPAPLLTSEDLIAAGVERGPRLGELLAELEDEQLEGRLDDRDAALVWLAARLR